MGTRADFYIGRGEDAEWLGSIGWDGYPSGAPEHVIKAKSEDEYRAKVSALVTTKPSDGWPWPWDDSATSDYAYAWDVGSVHASGFGGRWFDPSKDETDEDHAAKEAVFPDMSQRRAVTMDSKRSGLLILGVK